MKKYIFICPEDTLVQVKEWCNKLLLSYGDKVSSDMNLDRKLFICVDTTSPDELESTIETIERNIESINTQVKWEVKALKEQYEERVNAVEERYGANKEALTNQLKVVKDVLDLLLEEKYDNEENAVVEKAKKKSPKEDDTEGKSPVEAPKKKTAPKKK